MGDFSMYLKKSRLTQKYLVEQLFKQHLFDYKKTYKNLHVIYMQNWI